MEISATVVTTAAQHLCDDAHGGHGSSASKTRYGVSSTSLPVATATEEPIAQELPQKGQRRFTDRATCIACYAGLRMFRSTNS